MTEPERHALAALFNLHAPRIGAVRAARLFRVSLGTFDRLFCYGGAKPETIARVREALATFPPDAVATAAREPPPDKLTDEEMNEIMATIRAHGRGVAHTARLLGLSRGTYDAFMCRGGRGQPRTIARVRRALEGLRRGAA